MKLLHRILIIALSFWMVDSGDISTNVFGSHRHILPFAFGDFNSDELTDIFVTRNNSQVLEILLASEKEPLLRTSSNLTCNFTTFKVTSVVPGDFDGDAFMDILITTQNITQNTSESLKLHDVRIIWGGEDKLNCSVTDLPSMATLLGHPLALDYNQDMIIDLFGVNTEGVSTFWVFNHTRTRPLQIPLSPQRHFNIRLPHSHSFLDINGDYTSDLLITTDTCFEIWLGDVYDHGFKYYDKIETPMGLNGHIGQSLYLDVELSGKLYLLLPVCYDKACINCSIILNDDGVWKTLEIDFFESNERKWGFVPPNPDIAYTDTITLRGGDYNMDGYPDLLVSLKLSQDMQPQAFLLENVPCVSSTCTFKRTYKIQWNALSPFGNGTVLSVFYDFYQDGILDFILVQHNKTSNQYTIGALKNSLEYDANFIKVMVLTGLKNKRIPVTVGALGKKKGTYGTNLPGPRISYHTLSQEGLPRDGVCAQLPQSAYNVLNLPYSIFGLDRTPNFVDTLTVGLSNCSKTWTQLIPNSQVVVIPWPRDDPANWKVQLFVTPSKTILTSVYVYTGLLGILIIVVLLFHYKEVRKDKLEFILANSESNRVLT